MVNRTDAQWRDLVRDLAARVDAYSPGWTDHQDGDPGITLVELFAFLAESLLERDIGLEETRSRVLAVLDRLESDGPPCKDPLRKNRYAFGMVLGVDDFKTEQEYVREKHRRHNVHLHGPGIVEGLEVVVDPGEARPLVTVSPGVAISPLGDELVICERQTSRGQSGGSLRYVTLKLVDRPVDPLPDGEASRLEEQTQVAVVARVPADHLVIGRLERVAGAWRVAAGSRPKRVGR